MSEVERLYAADLAYSQLTADINDSVTSMTVETGGNFPQTPFLVIVGNEIIKVNGYDEMTGIMSELGRGHSSSIANSHSSGDRVALAIIADYINNAYDYIDDHSQAETGTEHGAVSAATNNMIIRRDSNGRARVAAPDHDDDIARKQDVDAKVSKAGDTLTGDLDFDYNLADKLGLKVYRETSPSATSGSGTRTFDVANGTVFKHTLTGNITVALTAPGTSGPCFSLTLIFKMDSTARTITWPTAVKWHDDEIPDVPPVNRVAVYTLFTINNGSRWYGFQAGNNMVE